MSDFHEEHDELLDLEQSPSAEELQDQVKRAQAELLQLRQKQEEIEKEKQRLEDLTRRQEELEKGRADIADKLARAIVTVQRETEESQRRFEQLTAIHEAFTEHLRSLEEIDPRSWHGRDLPRELTKALGKVDEARSSYARNHSKLAPSSEPGSELLDDAEPSLFAGGLDGSFLYWLRCGVAFTLPVLVLGLIAILLLVWHLAH
jgi:DNA repair exonuclease SbcCD ATPase subunit